MSDGIVVEVANRLWQAELNRSPISPITDAHPELGIEDAYAIQSHNIERRVGTGRVIRGRKVGLTAKPVQDMFGVREPDFGVLLDDMFVEDGDEVPLDTLLQPRVEAEMAFLIGRDLAGPGVTTSNALAAIAGVLPSIEIVDSRIADWKIKLIDTVADNAVAVHHMTIFGFSYDHRTLLLSEFGRPVAVLQRVADEGQETRPGDPVEGAVVVAEPEDRHVVDGDRVADRTGRRPRR